MLKKNAEMYQTKRADKSLQAVLWTLWTLVVGGTAAWLWRLDVAANRPVNVLGIVIYGMLVGLVGMLVITLIELWLEPERFVD